MISPVLAAQGMIGGVLATGRRPGGFTGAYDAIPSQVGSFSFARRVVSTYTGSGNVLRRSTDDDLESFGFLSNGDVPVDAIASWMGAGSAYYHTLADQSGDGNDATQATSANQPLYVASGQNGRPVGRFDGTDDFLYTPYSPSGQITLLGVRKYSLFDSADKLFLSCHKANLPSGGFIFGAYAPSGTHDKLIVQTGLGGAWVDGVNHLNTHLLSVLWGIDVLRIAATDTEFWMDGVSKVDDNSHGAIAIGNDLRIGRNAIDAHPPGYWNGDIAELIICNAALSTADREAAEAAANAYWAIY